MVNDAHSFWLAARYQRVCQAPGCGKADADFQAHHVVPKQLLRRLHKPLDDPRNALRLCHHCHMQFEWAGPGKIALPVTCFTDENICYVFDTLRMTAVQLEGKYGPFDIDPRWTVHMEGRCECQRRPTSSLTA